MSTDFADLSTDELAKQINAEYSVILNSDRANYPRALSIGGKLFAINVRTEHGEWQTKLSALCPDISYETATKYIRVYRYQHQIAAAAAAKSVATTDLTIELALSLIAKKRTTTENTDDEEAGGDGKPTVEAMEARQAANAEAEAAELADDEIDIDAERLQRVDKTFDVLMRTYPLDELLDLTERLAKHLGMTLVPLDTIAALEEAITGVEAEGLSTTLEVAPVA